MSLVSPGVEVIVIDESQYASARLATVPYILIATAENKINSSGTDIAPGTISTDENNMYLISSQRELVSTFGNPFFYKTTGGDSINGYELNEYGLMAAYSVLGATNRAYVHRADVDLAELTASLSRPNGKPNNGTYWLDLTETSYGVFAWNSASNLFNYQDPILITDIDSLEAGLPLSSIGNIGEYAIVTTNANNPVYFKNTANEWVLIGSDDWKLSLPTIIGSESAPLLTASSTIVINGVTVINPGTTLDTLVTAINAAAIPTVETAKVNDKLEFYVSSGFGSANSSLDVTITIDAGGVGDLLTEIGVTAGTYAGPVVEHGNHTQVPRWRATDTTPRPNNSVWVKTTAVNEGMHMVIKRYDALTDTFTEQQVPAYMSDQEANKWLDPAYGGLGIEVGDTYALADVNENDTGTVKVMERAYGPTSITGAVDEVLFPDGPEFVVGHKFEISVSQINDVNLTLPTEIEIMPTASAPNPGDTVYAADFVTDLLAAGLANITAEVTPNNRVNITHTGGGVIVLEDTAGGAVAATGIEDTQESVRTNNAGQLVLSNWNTLDYSADTEEPGQDPLDGTRWYYNEISEADIMIQDDGAWRGYRNVDHDVRGFDLRLTNPEGPMLSFVAPETQEDGSPLEYGDLWIDTSDLENYPLLSRWEEENGYDAWILIDTADSTSIDGLIFADARWGFNEETDPISDDMPAIDVLVNSNYVDIDAPNPDLYPPGMLMFNTRRSGYNVKEFRTEYFNDQDFGDAIMPIETNTWVTVSGNKDDGRANMGRQAQRALIVAAMRASIDTSEDIREEQREFNLLACPGYPELMPNMVALNNERNNTGFIIGDTPFRLSTAGAELVKWGSNNQGEGMDTEDGLISNDEYLGVYYPSCKTTDLSGSEIVQPPSHMMLRTIIHSDQQSYPWFAPAGIRRGQVDNAIGIGYIDEQTGEFQQKQIRQGVRDTLYQSNINPITFMPGAGITAWGQKTTKPGSALDRVNVARLVNYLRKHLEILSKPFLFEPNDELTRNEIRNVIEGLLNDLISKRALYDYSVVCDKSNNTPFRIDRNELWVDIAIEPVKAVEFIYIPLRIKNTGEISGTAS